MNEASSRCPASPLVQAGSFPWLAADVGFIDLNKPLKRLVGAVSHSLSDAVGHEPRGLGRQPTHITRRHTSVDVATSLPLPTRSYAALGPRGAAAVGYVNGVSSIAWTTIIFWTIGRRSASHATPSS